MAELVVEFSPSEYLTDAKLSRVKLMPSDLALVLLLLQGGECTLTAGKGLRISETLERLSHPLPSKTHLFGQPFERRETEALLGFAGSTLHHPCERTGFFFDILLGECLFVWGEFAWSATARVIMQTLGAMMFPFLDPGRHGDAMDLIGMSNDLDGRAGGTQHRLWARLRARSAGSSCIVFSKS
jgi:hypothetical protein